MGTESGLVICGGKALDACLGHFYEIFGRTRCVLFMLPKWNVKVNLCPRQNSSRTLITSRFHCCGSTTEELSHRSCLV